MSDAGEWTDEQRAEQLAVHGFTWEQLVATEAMTLKEMAVKIRALADEQPPGEIRVLLIVASNRFESYSEIAKTMKRIAKP